MTARRVHFEGHVQGVGFRYQAKQIARGYEVTGWIRNLPDGRVLMEVMASEADELAAFITEIRENSPLAHHIKACSIETIPPLTGSRGFDILP